MSVEYYSVREVFNLETLEDTIIYRAYILQAHGLWFILHIKICQNINKIYHKLRHLHRKNLQEFEYKILFIKENYSYFLYGQTKALNDPLNVKEKPTSISKIIINTWEPISDFKFAIEVQKAEPQNWLQNFAAPCKNVDKSCVHEDFPNKSLKHEKYFCPYFTTCRFCDISMVGGELFPHFAAKHEDIVQKSGAFWTPNDTGSDYHICVVNFCREKAVCEYSYENNVFGMFVYTPLKSDELFYYQCEIKFMDLRTKNVVSFLMDSTQKEVFDWSIDVKTNFSTDFNVCIVIDTK